MKAVKETTRKYYKYQYNDFVQPVLTANGTMGGGSFACSDNSTQHGPVFNAFNLGNTKNVHYDTMPAIVIFYNPFPLNVTEISWTVYDNNRNPIKYTVQASNDGTDYTDIITNQTSSAAATTTMDMSNNAGYYKYYKIVVDTFNTGVGNLKKIDITAQEQTVIDGTESDYDFYEDNKTIYKLPTKTVRTYYKYQYSDWTQPVLTADGTMGGSEFAVRGANSGSYAYLAYDGNTSTYLALWSNSVNETYFYNPNPLKISTLGFTYYPSTWISKGEIYGSNDDENYVLLTTFSHSSNSGTVEVNNEIPYKYFKLKVISAVGHTGYGSYVIADIYELEINAQEQVVVECSESDYDFYENKIIYYGIGE